MARRITVQLVGLSVIFEVNHGLDDHQSSLPKKISVIGYIGIPLCCSMLVGDVVS